MEGNAAVISADLKQLINEMNYFQMITNEATGHTKYEAIE